MPRDASTQGPWQRVVRTGWTANAALAFVLLALAALATLPVLNERRAAPLNRELRDVIEPGRGLVTQIHVALAVEGAAIRDYRESGDTVFLSRYRQAYATEAAAYEKLSRLANRLGPKVRHRFAQLRDLEQRWHSAISRSLGDANRRSARSERPRPEDLYEELLVAAAHLDEALSQDARARRQRLDDAERFQRWLAVILAMIAFAAGLGVAWLGQRVRVFAREAEQRRMELERAMESRARLMRGVSHDLKNPLGAIDGHAALLEAGVKGALTPSQLESVGRIRRSVRSLLMLINDLLELSRAEAGQLRIQLRCTDVADLVRDVVEEHRAAAEAAGHKLTVETSDNLPPIDTDPGRVRQILGNLLSNAVKYTPNGGSILVRSGERTSDGRLPAGRWVAIDVADSGPGIPREKLEEIFEEFSRLDAGTKPGAGLGLTIARRISRFLGGEVSVASRYGEGAAFTLWLPVDRRGTDRRSFDRRRANRTGG